MEWSQLQASLPSASSNFLSAFSGATAGSAKSSFLAGLRSDLSSGDGALGQPPVAIPPKHPQPRHCISLLLLPVLTGALR